MEDIKIYLEPLYDAHNCKNGLGNFRGRKIFQVCIRFKLEAFLTPTKPTPKWVKLGREVTDMVIEY